jgi:hypothetical protein
MCRAAFAVRFRGFAMRLVSRSVFRWGFIPCCPPSFFRLVFEATHTVFNFAATYGQVEKPHT